MATSSATGTSILSTSQSSVLTTAPQTNVSRSSLGEEVRLLKCDQTTTPSGQYNPRGPASNFLVNAPTGAFGISIAGNGDINPEDIYEVLVGATADGTSISTLCERSENSFSGNDILYHLRTKFDLDTSHQLLSTRWDAQRPDTPAAAFICGRGAVSVPNFVRY